MQLRHITPILNVSSVPASLAWFETLGWKRGFSWNAGGMIEGAADRNSAGDATFASVCAGQMEIFLCQDGQGSRGELSKLKDEDAGGVWMSWWVPKRADVDAVHALALSHGMIVTWPPTDEPWGVREFHLRHPDGHTFRISSGHD